MLLCAFLAAVSFRKGCGGCLDPCNEQALWAAGLAVQEDDELLDADEGEGVELDDDWGLEGEGGEAELLDDDNEDDDEADLV
jgi:hypothetical protein